MVNRVERWRALLDLGRGPLEHQLLSASAVSLETEQVLGQREGRRRRY